MKRCLFLVALVLFLGMLHPAHGWCAEQKPPTAVASAEVKQLDVNTATKEELDSVRGIGPVLAERIIDYRSKYGPFKKVDDLVNVPGIGPLSLEQFRAALKVSPQK